MKITIKIIDHEIDGVYIATATFHNSDTILKFTSSNYNVTGKIKHIKGSSFRRKKATFETTLDKILFATFKRIRETIDNEEKLDNLLKDFEIVIGGEHIAISTIKNGQIGVYKPGKGVE